MGLSFSCPFGDIDDLDRRFEAVLVRSLSVGSGDIKSILRSVSFDGHDSESTITESSSTRRMLYERSLSFKGRELFRTPTGDMENKFFRRPLSLKNKDAGDELQRSRTSFKSDYRKGSLEFGDRRYQAALKLQKVYKSFRTRRRLADCAVVAEQRWWKLLDFAELKRSSISFFEIEKQETASSRWSRARTRAAKVGKGLSKAEKARKLALQHWLEAIDPRHRYGHNLQFYYHAWLHCASKQPFFYWLDIGEGKELNHERCPRSRLHQQCIKYLGPIERKAYEVVIENGKLIYGQSRILLDTKEGPPDAKWIFVLSVSKILYVGMKKKGTFQHSSFLAGGATLSAGRLVVENGVLKAVWPHSGHYLPTEENFEEFMSFLRENNVDLTNVQKSPDEEEGEAIAKVKSTPARLKETDEELTHYVDAETGESVSQASNTTPSESNNPNKPKLELFTRFHSKLARLQIPNRGDVYDIFKTESLPKSCRAKEGAETPSEDGYETAEESFISEEEFTYPKSNLFDEDEEEDEKPIPKEKIMKRIDSHKGMKSYQLAQQLHSTWTTGAGPRISCMRDYPLELQFRVLEQAQLSPGATSPYSQSPCTPARRRTSLGKSPLAL